MKALAPLVDTMPKDEFDQLIAELFKDYDVMRRAPDAAGRVPSPRRRLQHDRGPLRDDHHRDPGGIAIPMYLGQRERAKNAPRSRAVARS